MSEFKLPDTLRQHRPLLLALEAIGWLHMTGKAKVDFLYSQGGRRSDYEYEKWYENERPPFPWDDRLNWVKGENSNNKNAWSDTLNINAWPDTLTDFIRKHTKRDEGLLGLLQASHAMASGIEKNLPKATAKYLGQDTTHMWLSTAFGFPVRNLLTDPPEMLTEAGWNRLIEQIGQLLECLENLGTSGSSNDLDAWWRWRDGAVGPEGWLRKAFTSTLAETRLPNNDVTLFDQSYVAAALFKSAAAGAILEGRSFDWNNRRIKQQTRWRLLTVGIGAHHYEARTVKIGDWTGSRMALDEFFRKVRRLVEIDLAVGALLYMDGETCVFSFPGEQSESTGGDLQIEDWKNWLNRQIDGYAVEDEHEIPPYCNISEPSRSLVGMTDEIRKTRETMTVPLHRHWKIPGQGSPDGHVCPVCLVRRSSDQSSKQTPCKHCKDRRIGRLDASLGGKLETDSIWISEVAGSNDRVALITMSLDIEPWLDGTRPDTLRTQSIFEWSKQNSTAKKSLPENYYSMVDLLIASFDSGNKAGKAKSLISSKIAPGLKENGQWVPWEKFYKLMVEDRADAPGWKKLDDGARARWLTHQLFRKLASPGRIYRFQRQAEDFFKVLLAEFREIAATDRNRWRTRRLVIKPDNGSSASWKDRQTYNGRYLDAPISLLYRKKTGDFMTICNLARLLKPEQDKEVLSGIPLELKAEEGEYKKKTEKLIVKSVSDDAGELGVYHPVISLDLSPVRFRVLVPLEAASKCVDRAINAWNDQFARVWDRLPLRIGIVAFPRMTPFQAVIEAARNIEADLSGYGDKPETWRVKGFETREGVAALTLVRPDGQDELRTLPVKFPDGRKDVFYPYHAVEDKQTRFPHDFQHPDGQVYRHTEDLRIGDGLFVCPSLITTIFLDSTAKRFEPLNCRQIMEWRQMRNLWKLIDRIVPSRTALRGAWSELVERRAAWKGPDGKWLEGGEEAWLDLARAVFHVRLGVRNACLETLVQAARVGLLEWSLEWHMSVLKNQVSGPPSQAGDRTQTGGD